MNSQLCCKAGKMIKRKTFFRNCLDFKSNYLIFAVSQKWQRHIEEAFSDSILRNLDNFNRINRTYGTSSLDEYIYAPILYRSVLYTLKVWAVFLFYYTGSREPLSWIGLTGSHFFLCALKYLKVKQVSWAWDFEWFENERTHLYNNDNNRMSWIVE